MFKSFVCCASGTAKLQLMTKACAPPPFLRPNRSDPIATVIWMQSQVVSEAYSWESVYLQDKPSVCAANAWKLIAKNSQYFAEHRCNWDIAEVDRHLAIVLFSLDESMPSASQSIDRQNWPLKCKPPLRYLLPLRSSFWEWVGDARVLIK